MILSVCPYGIQSAFFTFQFLAMDKKDEYQLIYFIVNYKKMQCITQGIALGVYGYISFYSCVSLASEEEQGNVYTHCKEIGNNLFRYFKYKLDNFLIRAWSKFKCLYIDDIIFDKYSFNMVLCYITTIQYIKRQT